VGAGLWPGGLWLLEPGGSGPHAAEGLGDAGAGGFSAPRSKRGCGAKGLTLSVPQQPPFPSPGHLTAERGAPKGPPPSRNPSTQPLLRRVLVVGEGE